MADEVLVMYAGQIVERATVVESLDNPRHPYTRGLFAGLPRIDGPRKRPEAIEGSVPAATNFPEGCRFHDRCRWREEKCKSEQALLEIGAGHSSRCWKHAELVELTPAAASR